VSSGSSRDRRRTARALTAALIGAAAVFSGPPAAHAHGLRTGFADELYESANPHQRSRWLDRTRDAASSVVRVDVPWSRVAGSRPAHPRSPSDPAYDFGFLDAAVRSAAGHHLTILMTVYSAPRWAEGRHRARHAPAGTWKPKPGELGDFAHALAARYSGHHGTLPRVRYYEAWNEPNLSEFLAPQYHGKRQVSASHYRAMLNAFYGGVHSAAHGDAVLNGGLAPYGEPPGGDRTRPLTFMRKLLCLKRRSLRAARCPHKAHLDVFADHPIDTSGGPHRAALNPNDVATPDFHRITQTLRAAERHRTVSPGGHRPLWATELWWDSNPPDTVEGVPLRRQARWLEEAQRILWKQGASVVINLQIRDGKFDPSNAARANTTGVYFHDSRPKPSLRAWRFPFVVTHRSHGSAGIWVRPPESGRLRVQSRRHGHWHGVRSVKVRARRISTFRVRVGSGRPLRAVVGKSRSLPWG
jgi:hypothetical protein